MDKEHENTQNVVEATAQTSTEAETQGEKTFSQEKLDEIVQKRLREQKEKLLSQKDEEIQKAIAEYERQSKLSEEDRRAEEEKKRQAELDRRDQELNFERAKFETVKILSEKGIDIAVADFLINQDLEKTKANIENFEKAFNSALEKSVNERLKGSTPADTSTSSDATPPASGIIAM